MPDSDNYTFGAFKSLPLEVDPPVLHIPGPLHLPTHGVAGHRKTRVSQDGEKENDIFSLPPATPSYRPLLDPFGSLQRPLLITCKRHRKMASLYSHTAFLVRNEPYPAPLAHPTVHTFRLPLPASSKPTPSAQPDQAPFGSAWADLLDDNDHHDILSSPADDIFDIGTLALKASLLNVSTHRRQRQPYQHLPRPAAPTSLLPF
ncbi:hypothetical protein DM01DRAFT_1406808, partial [Hesseltinella vesiculosa]